MDANARPDIKFARHPQLTHVMYRVIPLRDKRLIQCMCQRCGDTYEYPCYGDNNRLKARILNYCVQHAHR